MDDGVSKGYKFAIAIGLYEYTEGAQAIIDFLKEGRKVLIKRMLHEGCTNPEWHRAQAASVDQVLNEIEDIRAKQRRKVEGSAKEAGK